ncbi:MAG TPA: ethanolamine ammonia-lyase subunit EutB, partial [Myxococcota bacterium]|nr:ethanolamine ammonia-lyase subunit EutB [Myxococcota bacterium]
MYKITLGIKTYQFSDLKELMAKATPLRSADQLAELAAHSASERVAAQMCLADLPLKRFLEEELISATKDEVTRLIQKQFDNEAFKKIAHHTVGSLREYLLLYTTQKEELTSIRFGLTPEMVAAVSKLMRNQDLIAVSAKCEVTSFFRNTMGLKGHLGVRLQPNHPTDDCKGIAASILDGLVLGAGDAVIGINPASDSPHNCHMLLSFIDQMRLKLDCPTQSCVLTHITTQMQLIEQKSPVDLVFQSIAGTEAANKSFGIDLTMLNEAHHMALEAKRAPGPNVMYFETGQGSALSANAHFGVDAQTCETRAYAVAREFSPFLVNSVVGFIGPEYLYDGKQIIRAGLEDHFCAKLLGVPMGCDICYTNHSKADQNDMDVLLTLLSVAG